jgi:hypothetical protein
LITWLSVKRLIPKTKSIQRNLRWKNAGVGDSSSVKIVRLQR